jgi:hypothetical protein
MAAKATYSSEGFGLSASGPASHSSKALSKAATTSFKLCCTWAGACLTRFPCSSRRQLPKTQRKAADTMSNSMPVGCNPAGAPPIWRAPPTCSMPRPPQLASWIRDRLARDRLREYAWPGRSAKALPACRDEGSNPLPTADLEEIRMKHSSHSAGGSSSTLPVIPR